MRPATSPRSCAEFSAERRGRARAGWRSPAPLPSAALRGARGSRSWVTVEGRVRDAEEAGVGRVSSEPPEPLHSASSAPADAGEQAAGALRADPCPVPAHVPGRAGRGVSLQAGQPRRGRARRGHGQILLGAATLHQPHHPAEVRGLRGTHGGTTLPAHPGVLGGTKRGQAPFLFLHYIPGQDRIRINSR